MEYHVNKLSTFIKFKRLEAGMTQKEFSEKIFVSRSLVNNIENGSLSKLDQHIDNIFKCFDLDASQYTDQDDEWIQKVHEIIHQTIYYELPSSIEKTMNYLYFRGIENTYLYLYCQLVKTCLYARQYINDDWLEKYLPIFDSIILQFDETIQQFYQVLKCAYYKERRMFELCDDIEQSLESHIAMTKEMKSFCYHGFALRYMYEGNMALEFEYVNLAKEHCIKTNNQRRLIALVTVECDVYEKSGNLNKVIELFKEALVMMDRIQFDGLRNIFLSNLGITYCYKKEYQMAIDYLSLSIKQNNDNLDLFYLTYSYMRLSNKVKALNLLENQYQVKCFDEVFTDLLEWCRQSLKRPYTKKCGNMLEKIYKRHYQKVSVNTKKFILELLADHHENQDNYVLAYHYQNELINIMRGGNV